MWFKRNRENQMTATERSQLYGGGHKFPEKLQPHLDAMTVGGSVEVDGDPRNYVPTLASTLQRYCVDWIPEGVVIKRISSRGTKNKWGVWYFTSPTKYYARTLDEAFTEFFRNNKKYLEIYNLNAVESQHEQRSN